MFVRNGKLRRRFGQLNPQQQVVNPPAQNGQFQQPYQPSPTQQMPVAPQQPQYQPQPQQQAPVVSQQPPAQPQQQTFTLPLPNLNGQQPQAPQQQAPASNDAWSSIHSSLATQLGTTPDKVRELIGNDPNNIATIVKRGFDIQQQQRNQQLTPPSQTQQPAQAQPAAQPTGPVMYDLPQGWENYVRQDPNTGLFEPMRADFSQIAGMANHNQQLQRSRLIEISKNPAKVLEFPEVQKVLNAQLDARLSEYVGKRELESQQQAFWSENGKHLVAKDFYGNETKTPLGEAFSGALQQLGDSGMKPGKTLYETALLLAQKQVGPIQQAQPQQGNQQQGPSNPGNQPPWGQQQQPNNAQISQQQAPNVDPVRQMLDMNSQSNRIYPGSAPNRPQAPYQNTREAMLAGVSDMPDGLPIGAYLNRLNGRM